MPVRSAFFPAAVQCVDDRTWIHPVAVESWRTAHGVDEEGVGQLFLVREYDDVASKFPGFVRSGSVSKRLFSTGEPSC